VRLYGMMAFTLALVSACAADGGAIRKNPVGRDEVLRCIGGERAGCAQFASARCPAGFEIFEKDTPEEDGVVRRAFYFKCL